jgi:dihydropteroate synthase
MATTWTVRGRTLSLAEPLIMGVLNVTPDSFSDGGRFIEPAAAVAHAERMVADGAGVIDVGGESTRPGARPVPEDEEAARVLPVIRLLRRALAVPISVDTRKASVARSAIDAGADIINDVSALGDPFMSGVVVDSGAGLVLMHMRGVPESMQLSPRYDDAASEVAAELDVARDRALSAGVPDDSIALDPGIGFGKTAGHNLVLMNNLDRITALGRPVMIGVSRKAFIGTLLGGADAGSRLMGTVAACVAGLMGGARIFRVHDVSPVRDALLVAEAIRTSAAAP